jgi:acetoin utilization deacetylase AcuC-like enzyme
MRFTRVLLAIMVLRLFSRHRALVSNRLLSVAQQSKTMDLFYNDVYEVPLPPTHKFPMQKYRAVRELLQYENSNNPQIRFSVSPRATAEELGFTHCPTYVDRYFNGQLTNAEVRKTGFPWTPANVIRSTSSAGGTVAAMRSILSSEDSNMACHLAGGTHHAFYNYGEGFCIFSDIAVACNLALREFPHQVRQVLIVDLDVHQGNGNAVLFAQEPRVFTFSMHCRENYFSRKEHSNVDVELEPGTGDEEYMEQLQLWLPKLFDTVKPDLVFYQAGVDIFEGDRLGKLKVTREGLQRRNAAVYQEVMARNMKCVVTMGGG